MITDQPEPEENKGMPITEICSEPETEDSDDGGADPSQRQRTQILYGTPRRGMENGPAKFTEFSLTMKCVCAVEMAVMLSPEPGMSIEDLKQHVANTFRLQKKLTFTREGGIERKDDAVALITPNTWIHLKFGKAPCICTSFPPSKHTREVADGWNIAKRNYRRESTRFQDHLAASPSNVFLLFTIEEDRAGAVEIPHPLGVTDSIAHMEKEKKLARAGSANGEVRKMSIIELEKTINQTDVQQGSDKEVDRNFKIPKLPKRYTAGHLDVDSKKYSKKHGNLIHTTPSVVPTLESSNNDKRRNNLSKGHAEIDRRRLVLPEEEDRRRAEEKSSSPMMKVAEKKKLREAEEKREQERLEYERRRETERIEAENKRAAERERHQLEGEKQKAREVLEKREMDLVVLDHKKRHLEADVGSARDVIEAITEESLKLSAAEREAAQEQKRQNLAIQMQVLDQKKLHLELDVGSARDVIEAITEEIEGMQLLGDEKLKGIANAQTKNQQSAVHAEQLAQQILPLQGDKREATVRASELDDLATRKERAETKNEEMKKKVDATRERNRAQQEKVTKKRQELEGGLRPADQRLVSEHDGALASAQEMKRECLESSNDQYNDSPSSLEKKGAIIYRSSAGHRNESNTERPSRSLRSVNDKSVERMKKKSRKTLPDKKDESDASAESDKDDEVVQTRRVRKIPAKYFECFNLPSSMTDVATKGQMTTNEKFENAKVNLKTNYKNINPRPVKSAERSAETESDEDEVEKMESAHRSAAKALIRFSLSIPNTEIAAGATKQLPETTMQYNDSPSSLEKKGGNFNARSAEHKDKSTTERPSRNIRPIEDKSDERTKKSRKTLPAKKEESVSSSESDKDDEVVQTRPARKIPAKYRERLSLPSSMSDVSTKGQKSTNEKFKKAKMPLGATKNTTPRQYLRNGGEGATPKRKRDEVEKKRTPKKPLIKAETSDDEPDTPCPSTSTDVLPKRTPKPNPKYLSPQ